MQILKNTVLQDYLSDQGYVVFDFLSSEKVKQVLDEFQLIRGLLPSVNGFHISLEHSDEETRAKLAKMLPKMLTEEFNSVFQRFKVFQGSFAYKEPSREDNPVNLHQDWAFVDEDAGDESYTLWVALSEVRKDNGAIGVIPKSHRELLQLRFTPNEAYKGYENIPAYAASKELKYLELDIGQAILWNHKLVHCSLPNVSGQERLNATFCVTGQDIGLKLHWFSPDHNRVMMYDVADDFYHTRNSRSFLDAYNKGVAPVH